MFFGNFPISWQLAKPWSVSLRAYHILLVTLNRTQKAASNFNFTLSRYDFLKKHYSPSDSTLRIFSQNGLSPKSRAILDRTSDLKSCTYRLLVLLIPNFKVSKACEKFELRYRARKISKFLELLCKARKREMGFGRPFAHILSRP